MRHAPPITDFPRYPVTGGTILLAATVFLLQSQGKDIAFLHTDIHIMTGQVWRLVTSILPHGSVLHILFNLYWMWNLGALAESKYGSLRTAALYVYLAAVSSGWEYAILDGGQGLSGVGYGLFGLFWARRGLDRDADLAADRNTAIAFLGWGVLCIVATYFNTLPVANIAHGMGLVAGMIIGRAIGSVRRSHRTYYRVAAVATLIVTLVAAVLAKPYITLSRFTAWDLQDLAIERAQAGHSGQARHFIHLARTAAFKKDADHFNALAAAVDASSDSDLRAYLRPADASPGN